MGAGGDEGVGGGGGGGGGGDGDGVGVGGGGCGGGDGVSGTEGRGGDCGNGILGTRCCEIIRETTRNSRQLLHCDLDMVKKMSREKI